MKTFSVVADWFQRLLDNIWKALCQKHNDAVKFLFKNLTYERSDWECNWIVAWKKKGETSDLMKKKKDHSCNVLNCILKYNQEILTNIYWAIMYRSPFKKLTYGVFLFTKMNKKTSLEKNTTKINTTCSVERIGLICPFSRMWRAIHLHDPNLEKIPGLLGLVTMDTSAHTLDPQGLYWLCS